MTLVKLNVTYTINHYSCPDQINRFEGKRASGKSFTAVCLKSPTTRFNLIYFFSYRCVDFPILTPCFFVLWLFMYYSTSIPLPPPICRATARDRGKKMARGRAKKKTNLTRLRFSTDTLYKRKAISHASFLFKNFDYIRFQEIRAWRYISYFNKKWKGFLSDH